MRKALAVGLLVLVTCPMLRAENYDLRSKYKVGQVITVRSLWDSSMKVTEADNKDVMDTLKGEFRSVRKAEVRYTIAKVRKGTTAVANAEVIAADDTEQMPGVDEKTTSSPATGKTVVVTTDAEGKSTYGYENGGEVDKAAQDLCNDLDEDLFRGIDVSNAAVGQEWTVPEDVARKVFDISAKGEASVTLKFAEVLDQDDRHLARLTMAARLQDEPEDEEGMTMRSMQLTGDYLWDLDRHITYKVTAEGTVKITGTDKDMGNMTLEGPIAIKSEFEDVTGK